MPSGHRATAAQIRTIDVDGQRLRVATQPGRAGGWPLSLHVFDDGHLGLVTSAGELAGIVRAFLTEDGDR